MRVANDGQAITEFTPQQLSTTKISICPFFNTPLSKKAFVEFIARNYKSIKSRSAIYGLGVSGGWLCLGINDLLRSRLLENCCRHSAGLLVNCLRHWWRRLSVSDRLHWRLLVHSLNLRLLEDCRSHAWLLVHNLLRRRGIGRGLDGRRWEGSDGGTSSVGRLGVHVLDLLAQSVMLTKKKKAPFNFSTTVLMVVRATLLKPLLWE